MLRPLAVYLAPVLFLAGAAQADTVQARCDIYPAGSDIVRTSGPCSFGQRQGNVSITRDDGVSHDLRPDGDVPGNFRDQHGNRVYRNSGLGAAGQIFRTPTESIFVYWDADAGQEALATNPFTTGDYDAISTLRCGKAGQDLTFDCPAGVMRLEDRQASVTVQGLNGDLFTLNFMRDSGTGKAYVNATQGQAEGSLTGDLWRVILNGTAEYEVPLAMIEGG